jgi:hypothetical protein
MTWLTWRQIRTPALAVYGALIVVALLLAITGPQLADLFGTDPPTPPNTTWFGTSLYLLGTGVVYGLPAVIGAFWGAPLVARELETGTHKVAWNQSVTRMRWLATKLGLIGLAALGSGLFSLAMSWWCAPVDKAVNAGTYGQDAPQLLRLSPYMFGARGLVPVGFAVLAFVLGVAAGLVLRRTVPAIAVTLLLVVGVQVLMPTLIQPHLLKPVTTAIPIAPDKIRGAGIHSRTSGIADVQVEFDKPGAWVVGSSTVDRAGKPVSTLPSWTNACLPEPGQQNGAGVTACWKRVADAGYRQQIRYQPASRYWKLQWIETAILALAAAALAGFSLAWLRLRFA